MIGYASTKEQDNRYLIRGGRQWKEYFPSLACFFSGAFHMKHHYVFALYILDPP